MEKPAAAVKKKGGLGSINPLVMVCIIILIAVALTYIIPAGSFEKSTDENGTEIINVKSFQYKEKNPTKLSTVPTLIKQSFEKSVSMIILIGASTAAFEVITQTGTFHAIIGKIIRAFKGKEKICLWVLTMFFALLATTVPQQVFIPFTTTCMALALALGYDDFTGTAMLILATAAAAFSMPLQSVTVALQSLLGLPAFSAVGWRFAILFIGAIISAAYLVHYAEKVRKDPSKSVVYGVGGEDRVQFIANLKEVEYPSLSGNMIAIIIEIVLAFALMIYGGQKLGWTDYNIAGVMLILGIVCGLTGKINLNKQAKMMGTGVKNMTNTFLIIGLATTVGTILKGAGNVDTIIKSISSGLSSWPVWLAPAGMMLVIAVINIFVPSATGKIPMLMPILSPLAKLLGVNQQVLTFVYMYGDGFTNYLLPYQSAIAGFVESGRVPFPLWLKFFWKLECIWIVMGAIVVCVAQAINIGPF